MRKCMVYTRFDGGVDVCHPTPEIIRWLGCGGFWGKRPPGWYDAQVESQVAEGVAPDAARRYVRAMILGGCTTAEALEIIRDRDCSHLGTAIELWDAADVPTDRWFRDAWRRSANGGPISISLKLARPIQFQHINFAFEAAIKRRSADLEAFDIPLDVDLHVLRQRILAAREEIELRSVWPEQLVVRH